MTLLMTAKKNGPSRGRFLLATSLADQSIWKTALAYQKRPGIG